MPSEETKFARHLRSNATDAERNLWHAIRLLRPGFTRQLSLGPYTVDFACRRARLIVELDGSQHVDSLSDASRTALLETYGWKVLRFWNNDVLSNIEGVVEIIIATANTRLPPGQIIGFIASRSGRERSPRTRKKKEPPPTPPANAEGE